MINWELFSIRNMLVIGTIAIVWHVLLSQVFKNIGGVSDDNAAS